MTEPSKLPAAPRGSGAAGRKLWRAIVEDFDLAQHELELLVRACRTADICQDLQAIVDREGVIVRSRLDEDRPHPALVELRQQSMVLARLLVALRVPLGDEDNQQQRSQHRGPRGVYGLRSLS